MEKVVTTYGYQNLGKHDVDEVNKYLADGWKVKSVTPASTKDYVSIVFVIENNFARRFIVFRNNNIFISYFVISNRAVVSDYCFFFTYG